MRGCTREEMADICRELGLKQFRAQQVWQWVQQQGVQTWEEITNISGLDKAKLATRLEFQAWELLREQRSIDGTIKYLFRLKDGETIECVLMNYDRVKSRDRHTVCVSTQVGCAVGCSFCATGLGGWKRNLSVGEIVAQVMEITRRNRVEDAEFAVTNVVFMGMGEPLLNYDAVLKAISILNAPDGQKIGMRRMTISTSGVAPKIRQLAIDNPQVGLAVSLHTAWDEVRNDLVPMNRRYPLSELMAACRDYSQITKRRITFEVAVIRGQADVASAEALANLLQGQLGHVNLIPVNPVQETKMARPSDEEVALVARILEQAGVEVSIREERGTDIEAACGQLRQHWESE